MIIIFFLNIYFMCLILWYKYVNGIYWKVWKYKIKGFYIKKCLYWNDFYKGNYNCCICINNYIWYLEIEMKSLKYWFYIFIGEIL